MPRHLGCQTGLQACHSVRTLATEAEAVMHLLIDGLDALASASQPAAQSCRPRLATTPLRWAHPLRAVPRPPARMYGLSFEAWITDRRAQSRRPNARASSIGGLAHGPAGFGQRLILGAGRSDAAAGDDPTWLDRDEEMAACIPAEAVTPADVR